MASSCKGEITGRAVLLSLLAFFGVVICVNVVLIWAAATTFGGLETESSYKAGLAFKSEISAARAQDDRQWNVEAKLMHPRRGDTLFEIIVRDRAGALVSGTELALTLAHPSDKRLDQVLRLAEARTGRFQTTITLPPGQRELVIELWRGDERVFRSQNRVMVP